MITAGSERCLVLQLCPVDPQRLGHVLRTCRVKSYQLDRGGRLRLQYDLKRTAYRHIRASLDANGIRARCRFCDALISPLLRLAEDNLQQQQHQLVSWASVLHDAYVAFQPRPQTRNGGVYHRRWHLQDDARESD